MEAAHAASPGARACVSSGAGWPPSRSGRRRGGSPTRRARACRSRWASPTGTSSQETKPAAVALAKRLGFDGVQISLGKGTDRLPLADPALQQTYLAESKRVGLPLASVCLEILHRNFLKYDPLGQRWVADSIPIARALGVKVILLPFFGKGALETQAEMDYVGDVLREVAPPAEKAGVILGLEDTISARDNVRIMERDQVTGRADLLRRRQLDQGRLRRGGGDPLAGRGPHLRGPPEGQPALPRQGHDRLPGGGGCAGRYRLQQWAQLETSSPSGSVEKDMATNLAYIRGVIARRQAG